MKVHNVEVKVYVCTSESAMFESESISIHAGNTGDIIPANFLDFPPNLGIFRPIQVILGHF